MSKSLLIIGLTWPEPKSTAAGRRMMQLIKLFLKSGFEITFASSSTKNERSVSLSKLNINEADIKLNESSFDDFLIKISPDIVLFDRYITEEQFGWRVIEHCPNALRILDTEDLHFLRFARQKAFESYGKLDPISLHSDIAKREIASIYRCDLSLIISKYEMSLLKDSFKIDDSLLHYLPFLFEASEINELNNLPNFKDRTDFITVGNFKHSPNADSVYYLKHEIWPKIRSQLPLANLNIYGAYTSRSIQELHNEAEGFLVKGPVDDMNKAMAYSRICLAPLRYGAGLKGKVIEAFLNGTVCIMSRLAAEGILDDSKNVNFIQDNTDKFVESAIRLYNDQQKWEYTSKQGLEIVKDNFYIEDFKNDFLDRIQKLIKDINIHRTENFIGQMLNHQSMQSTKYMSKWIEEKNS